MAVRLGEMMISQGLLTRDQVDEILAEQKRKRRPFGELAEQLFGVGERDVERAWAAQYAKIAEHVVPLQEDLDQDVIAMIDRRQAWQFRIMPLRRDGQEIMVATMIEHLPRAMRFALRHFKEPCYFVIASAEQLASGLMEHYPLAGMTPQSVLAAPSLTDAG